MSSRDWTNPGRNSLDAQSCTEINNMRQI